MGKSRPKGQKNGAARPAGEKAIIQGPVFAAGLQFFPEQRAAIEAAVSTPAKMRELYQRADRAGDPSPGTDIRAIRIGGAWLVFHEKADEIELAQLIEDRTFQQMGVRLTPTGDRADEAVGHT
jgi:hypothetical protein